MRVEIEMIENNEKLKSMSKVSSKCSEYLIYSISHLDHLPKDLLRSSDFQEKLLLLVSLPRRD